MCVSLACGGDDITVLVPSVGQQEPAREAEVLSELESPLALPDIDQVSLGPAVCKTSRITGKIGKIAT